MIETLWPLTESMTCLQHRLAAINFARLELRNRRLFRDAESREG
jgi:hypothetical protein